MMMKINNKKTKYLPSNLFLSISLAGIFLALVLILNFVFSPIKIPWSGGYSIQMFLVVYCFGVYVIQNKIVAICFYIIVPPVLFFTKTEPYIVELMQVFIEYFLVFYIFGIFLILPCIKKSKIFEKNRILEITIFVLVYIICIIVKFLLHTLASHIYWKLPWSAAFIANALSVLSNASITIPFLLISNPIVFLISNKFNNLSKIKY